ncbi:hypothetical protein Q8A67_008910 [Cirrhinus molitorella]|uniref:Ig-like domain-containing protein n=1 Tax=Cirrhinus molitorella TaxID=172907 RepID=A0AA88PZ97_9TELE|nr:hypothetical protein Q8A67_008910 [Cirrhinus molitorella]
MERQMSLMILIVVTGGFADKIGPKDGDTNVIKEEGEFVRLSCTYETNSNDVWLYWYRQYPNGEPQYLLLKGARSKSYENIADKRFRSVTAQSSTELITDKAALSDSALYYCALRVAQ